MFNSIMAVLTGSGEFYDSMHAFSANNWEQNHLAELYIRNVLELHVPNLKDDEYARNLKLRIQAKREVKETRRILGHTSNKS